MAYSDYGAFVYKNGERREDKEDVGVFDTDEASLPSGMRIWANLIKNMEGGHDEWWRRSQHGVMGDGNVRVSCYKQGFPTVYVWDEGAEAPRGVTQQEIIEHNHFGDYVPTWEYKGEFYIDTDEHDGPIEFIVPGLDGYKFLYERLEHYRAEMTEPDGSHWECDYDYGYGAGITDCWH